MKSQEILKRYAKRQLDSLLISEVTRMKGGYYCVAGLDLGTSEMVRPLQSNGTNWQLDVNHTVFKMGNVAEYQPTGVSNTTMPHATEDTRLKHTPIMLEHFSETISYELLLDASDSSVVNAIGVDLVNNKYVEDGTRCHSLGGVRAKRKRLEFHTDSNDKLRLGVTDTDATFYDLGVTCDRLQGISSAKANKWLSLTEPSEIVILRVGLARAWDGKKGWSPKRCYLQLNGVICHNDQFAVVASS